MARRWPWLLVPVALLGAWAFLRPSPPPPPPLPEPEPRAALPPDEPATVALGEALATAQAAYGPDTTRWTALDRALLVVGPPEPADLALWRPYAAAFAPLRAALARPGLRLNDNLKVQGVGIYRAWLLASALALRAWDHTLEGAPELGVQDLLLATTLGTRLVDAADQGGEVDVGALILWTSLRELGELLACANDPAALDAARGLDALRPRPGATLRVLERECWVEERRALAFYGRPGSSGTLFALGLSPQVDRLHLPRRLTDAVANQLLYDPASLVQALRARCAALRTELEKPPGARVSLRDGDAATRGGLRWLLDDPIAHAGSMYLSFVETIAAREEIAQAAPGVLLVWVAAQQQLLETGRAPNTAIELVPTRLAELPADPYSSVHIRLDHGRVWSLGAPASDPDAPPLALPIE